MRYFLLAFFLGLCMSCAMTVAHSGTDAYRLTAERVIDACIDRVTEFAGRELLSDVDHVYVEVFSNGHMVSFSMGAVGTFGKRSRDYRQVVACGVSEDQIVFLGQPLRDAYIDRMSDDSFDNYQEDVTELLFTLENGLLRFCCSQKFDEDNIRRNNPDYPWPWMKDEIA